MLLFGWQKMPLWTVPFGRDGDVLALVDLLSLYLCSLQTPLAGWLSIYVLATRLIGLFQVQLALQLLQDLP